MFVHNGAHSRVHKCSYLWKAYYAVPPPARALVNGWILTIWSYTVRRVHGTAGSIDRLWWQMSPGLEKSSSACRAIHDTRPAHRDADQAAAAACRHLCDKETCRWLLRSLLSDFGNNCSIWRSVRPLGHLSLPPSLCCATLPRPSVSAQQLTNDDADADSTLCGRCQECQFKTWTMGFNQQAAARAIAYTYLPEINCLQTEVDECTVVLQCDWFWIRKGLACEKDFLRFKVRRFSVYRQPEARALNRNSLFFCRF